MKAQVVQVLNMLRAGPLTRFEAHSAGVLNITARLADLRNLGCKIHCQMVTDPNHHDGKTRFGRWYLVSEPKEVELWK